MPVRVGLHRSVGLGNARSRGERLYRPRRYFTIWGIFPLYICVSRSGILINYYKYYITLSCAMSLLYYCAIDN